MIKTDGFINRDEAYDFLLSLKAELSDNKKIIAKRNFDNYLTNMKNGNVEFKFETRSCVIWWKSEKTVLKLLINSIKFISYVEVKEHNQMWDAKTLS